MLIAKKKIGKVANFHNNYAAFRLHTAEYEINDILRLHQHLLRLHILTTKTNIMKKQLFSPFTTLLFMAAVIVNTGCEKLTNEELSASQPTASSTPSR